MDAWVLEAAGGLSDAVVVVLALEDEPALKASLSLESIAVVCSEGEKSQQYRQCGGISHQWHRLDGWMDG